jgi:uncharacterized membrane protein YjfL (UPF0719 family)
MEEWNSPYVHGFAVLAVVLLLLLFARLIYAFLYRVDLSEALTTQDNPAASIAFGGFTVSFAASLSSVASFRSGQLLLDVQTIFLYGFLALALVVFCDRAHSMLLHPGIGGKKEIYEDRNVGVAIAKAGALVGSGLTLAGSLNGDGGGILAVLVFFILGQLALSLVGWIHRKTCGYGFFESMAQGNAAAGLSYAGTLIASGIILFNATSGNFTDWKHDLINFFIQAGLGLILVPVLRWIFDMIWMPGAIMSQEIARDKNWGVVLLEFFLLVTLSALFVVSFN